MKYRNYSLCDNISKGAQHRNIGEKRISTSNVTALCTDMMKKQDVCYGKIQKRLTPVISNLIKF